MLREFGQRLIPVILPLMGPALVGGCDGSTTAEQTQAERGSNEPTEDDLPRVVVHKPRMSDAEQEVVLPGSLEGHETAALHARTTGYIRTVEVDIGDMVKKGKVLARLIVPEVHAQLARARANVEAAKARIERKKAQLELAKVTRERLAKLREQDPGAISQQDVDEAKANAQIKEAEVMLAERDVTVARAEASRLETLSGFSTLRAPFSGRIIARELHPGALAREGNSSEAKPIIEIARTDPLRLAFQVPESFVPHVKSGHQVEVSFRALPDEERQYEVTRVAGALDPKTRYMRAEIDVPNPEGELRPGMHASVQLGVVTKKNALLLPSRAVRGSDTDRHVLVVREGVLEKQQVSIASDDGRRAIIVGGLSPDALVMVSGSSLAAVGSRVHAVVKEGETG